MLSETWMWRHDASPQRPVFHSTSSLTWYMIMIRLKQMVWIKISPSLSLSVSSHKYSPWKISVLSVGKIHFLTRRPWSATRIVVSWPLVLPGSPPGSQVSQSLFNWYRIMTLKSFCRAPAPLISKLISYSGWSTLIGWDPSRYCTLLGWDHGVATNSFES